VLVDNCPQAPLHRRSYIILIKFGYAVTPTVPVTVTVPVTPTVPVTVTVPVTPTVTVPVTATVTGTVTDPCD